MEFQQQPDNTPNQNLFWDKKRVLLVISAIFLALLLMVVIYFVFLKDNPNLEKVELEAKKEEFKERLNGIYQEKREGLDKELMEIDVSADNLDQYTYTIVRGDYRFRTPWGDGVEDERTAEREGSGFRLIEYSNGNTVLFECFDFTREEIDKELEDLEDYPKDMERLRVVKNYLGEKYYSPYEYWLALHEVTPEDVLQTETIDDFTNLSNLLFTKSGTLFSNKQPYHFSINDIKGFQYGRPVDSDSLTLFTFRDPVERCMFGLKLENLTTQEDINVILSSFEKL